MTVKRMDKVGIVVEALDAAIDFFTELGLDLEGRAQVEGDWADGVTGLHGMRVEIAMMRTPVTYASCSPWRTSTIRWPGSANAAGGSSAK
jgi:hypothetical protein